MRLLLMILLATAAGLASAADSDIDKVVAERNSAVGAAETAFASVVTKAQTDLDQETLRANAKAVVALERIAKRTARSGDMTTGAQAWKAILRYDREHADARGFFQAVGQLDSVLASLDEDAAADLIGGPQPAAEAGQGLPLAMLGTEAQVQIRSLSLGTDAIGGISTPITRIPDELAGASFIQPPVIASEPIRAQSFRQGQVALVAGPGYAGLQQIAAAGFTPASYSLGVSNIDQTIYIKTFAVGETIELPPGPLMVIAGTIRVVPTQGLGRGRR